MSSDDLLSTALCEAGLDEFLPISAPSSPQPVKNEEKKIVKISNGPSPVVVKSPSQPKLVRTPTAKPSGDVIAVKSFTPRSQPTQRLLVVRRSTTQNQGGSPTQFVRLRPEGQSPAVLCSQPPHLHGHAYSSALPSAPNGTKTLIYAANSPKVQLIRKSQSATVLRQRAPSPALKRLQTQPLTSGPRLRYPVRTPAIRPPAPSMVRAPVPSAPPPRPRLMTPRATVTSSPVVAPRPAVRLRPLAPTTGPPVTISSVRHRAPKPPMIDLTTTASPLRDRPSVSTPDMRSVVTKDMTPKQPKTESTNSPVLEDSLLDDEEENLGHADTYSEYRPSKLRSGLSHPDSVVETASLSSVPPPDIRYHISIPEEVIDTGAISALQLEAVIYACQQHENRLPSGERTGYLIGDGAGVGKGRTLAAIIFENYELERKRSLWFSVSSDLKYDAERDLKDIGASKIKVYPLNKFKYAKISGKENGSVKKGVIFSTYSSLIGECRTARGKYRSRLKQLIHWCGKDFDGVIVFDECHRAKNLVPIGGTKPTKTGKAVLELQKALPNARVVYASATGATEPRNMAYMTRLGLWGEGKSFPEFTEFINAVEKRGVGAMEIVAMDMKQRGLYLARQLSFGGVSFRVEEISLNKEFVKVFDDSVKLWLEARRQFQLAADLVDADRGQRKSLWGQFWASHQRFFKYLCIGAKVRSCVKMAREAVKNGKCVVIGLQSTGEARTLEQLEESGGELNDFVSTAKAVFLSLIDKHFPSGATKNFGGADFNEDPFGSLDFIMGDSSIANPKRRDSPVDDQPAAKRRRLASESSGDGSSGGESSDSEGSSEEEKEAGDDWLRTLFDEAASSSDDEPSDKEKEGKRGDTEDEDTFNPFADDAAEDDPWAAKQQQMEEMPSPEKSFSSVEADRKEKKRKKKRKHKNESRTPVDTADEFLASTRAVEMEHVVGSGRMTTELNINRASVIKAELMAAVERLGDQLPANTLDQLIDELGGPDQVAEMTGRKGRVVSREDGEIEYELRHEGDVALELLNLTEKERFMNGTKHIAIISEAASSGISLQSDRRALNQRRRVHITLELPWSADKAIQQFGRTHRSNQVNAPEYVFLISELAGEKRFASIVAKRLESLGALTHGDRRATETRDLSQFNLDTKYGRASLDVVIRSIVGIQIPIVPLPSTYQGGEFMNDMRQYLEGVGLLSSDKKGNYSIEKEANSIGKFLNRILGLPVHAQNSLFLYFSDTLAELVAEAKRDGRYDMGIVDLGVGGDHVKKQETRVFLGRMDEGNYRTEMHKISVERGLSWTEAMNIYVQHNGPDDGFYISTMVYGGKPTAALLFAIGKKRLDTGERLYCISRPNTGRNARVESLSELKKRFKRVLPDDAEPVWKHQFESSAAMCQHSYLFGRCRNEAAGIYCEVGRRTRTYFVLAGSVLSVWPVVESVLQTAPGRRQSKMQVIRVRTEQGQKIVGLLIPVYFVRKLIDRLEERTGRSYLETNNTKK